MSSDPKAASQTLIPYSAPVITAEEAERRIKEAEELEVKLKAVQENVPTRIYNVCGSAAGAGSGDFHQYRMIRRREQMRLKRIDEEAAKRQRKEEGLVEREKRKLEDEAKTAKRRAKRQKKKQRKVAKKKEKAGSQEAGDGGAPVDMVVDSDIEEDVIEQPTQAALD